MVDSLIQDLFRSDSTFFQVMIDAMPFPIFIKNAKGLYLSCNTQYEKVMSVSRKNFVGKTVYDLHDHEHAQVYADADKELLEKGGVQIYEATLPAPNATKLVVKFHKTVFYDSDGKPAGIIGAVFDITEHKELEEKLHELASQDELTGLYNRREVLSRFDQALRTCKEGKQPLSIILFDIDKFKAINDTYGHDVGDIAIQKTAAVLVENSRQSDIVSRYGGEEFLVLLPNTERVQAIATAERCLKAMENTSIQLEDKQLDAVTLSAGVSTSEFAITTPSVLLKEADQALYRAKEEGRNRVCIYT